MENESDDKDNLRRREYSIITPQSTKRDPSLSTTSTEQQNYTGQIRIHSEHVLNVVESKKWYTCCYNSKSKKLCGRTFSDWLLIILYAIFYLIFLTTYTMIFLYGSLELIKYTREYNDVNKAQLTTQMSDGIGLSAIPTSEYDYPLVWYKTDDVEDYQKYVNSIDRLLVNNRRKRDLNSTNYLGPCGNPPYGYGDSPCVIIKINKQLKWSGKPLLPNSTETLKAPIKVQELVKRDAKLWLHCNGHHSYDKDHIGNIKYYPDPPGFDPKIFPLSMESNSPLIAIQIMNFTKDISIAVECGLWYESGPSYTQFVIYVTSKKSDIVLKKKLPYI